MNWMVFSLAERRILNILWNSSFIKNHSLYENIKDNAENHNTLVKHISNMRKKLRIQGYDIISFQEGRSFYYKLVRFTKK